MAIRWQGWAEQVCAEEAPEKEHPSPWTDQTKVEAFPHGGLKLAKEGVPQPEQVRPNNSFKRGGTSPALNEKAGYEALLGAPSVPQEETDLGERPKDNERDLWIVCNGRVKLVRLCCQ